MRYLVTGGTGFLGNVLVRALTKAGHEVVALVRDPDRAKTLAGDRVVLATGDVRDAATVRAAMAGVDGVFHVAAWYQVGARDNAEARAINVDGTRNVLEAVRDLKIAKAVYTSTLAIHGDTGGRSVTEAEVPTAREFNSAYDRTKWEAHVEVALPLQRAGVPIVIVMPGVIYGPGDHGPVREALVMYLKGRLPTLPRDAAFCWAHVDDVARGHLLAMEKGNPGESYILAGPPHTMVEAFELAERLCGRPAPKIRIGSGPLRTFAKVMDVIESVVPIPPTFAAESLRSGASTYLGSNEKARRELGYDPRPLEVGLKEVLDWEIARLK